MNNEKSVSFPVLKLHEKIKRSIHWSTDFVVCVLIIMFHDRRNKAFVYGKF